MQRRRRGNKGNKKGFSPCWNNNKGSAESRNSQNRGKSAQKKDFNNRYLYLVQSKSSHEPEEENHQVSPPKNESDNLQLFLPVDTEDAFDYAKLESTKYTQKDIKAMLVNEI